MSLLGYVQRFGTGPLKYVQQEGKVPYLAAMCKPANSATPATCRKTPACFLKLTARMRPE